MKLISSTNTFFHKLIVPLCAGLFCAVLVIGALLDQLKPGGSRIAAVIGPLLMAGLSFMLLWQRNVCLADEVYDLGDALLVRKQGTEAKIALRNISNVTTAGGRGATRVILTLVNPCEFGTEIVFIPGGESSWDVVDVLRSRIGC